MEWNGRSSATVTETPMISNTMPIRINAASSKKAIIYPAPLSTLDDTKLNTAEMMMDIKKIFGIQ